MAKLFAATPYDKWKIGDAEREKYIIEDVDLEDHDEDCDVWIDYDPEDCTCPEGGW